MFVAKYGLQLKVMERLPLSTIGVSPNRPYHEGYDQEINE